MIKLLIFFTVIQITFSQPSSEPLTSIEEGLSNIYKNLMMAQQNLKQNLQDYFTSAQTCSKTLKSANVASLTSVLDQFVELLDKLRTIDEFKSYDNFSTCDDINYKIKTISEDFNKCRDVQSASAKNQSQLAPKYSQIYTQYAANIKNLGGMYSTNERMVFNILEKHKETIQACTGFSSFVGTSSLKLDYNIKILATYKNSYCLNAPLKTTMLKTSSTEKLTATNPTTTAKKLTESSTKKLTTTTSTKKFRTTTCPSCKCPKTTIATCPACTCPSTTSIKPSTCPVCPTTTTTLSTSTSTSTSTTSTSTTPSTTLTSSTLAPTTTICPTSPPCVCPTTSIASTTTMNHDTTLPTNCPTTSSTIATLTSSSPPSTDSTTQNPTTSTTSTSTTITTTQYPCGVFMPYDPVSDPNGPEIRGFAVGTFFDGSFAYVGHADNGKCNQAPCPARVCASPPLFAGGYVTCGSTSKDNSTAYYLLNHPDLYWIKTNSTDMMRYNNTITIKSYIKGFKFMFGRVKIGKFTTVGKVHCNQNVFSCWYQNQAGSDVGITSGYDVLACKSFY